MHPLIEAHRARILALAEPHGASGHPGALSDADDVDLLVSLAPNKAGLALGAMLVDVEKLLDRRVEVLTNSSLHPEIRGQALKETQPL